MLENSNVSPRRRWWLVFITCVLIVLMQCDKTAISICAVPISKELHFTSTQIGLVISIFFTAYTISNFFAGVWLDKFGGKKTIAGVVILWSIFTALTGAAWSFASLVGIRFMFGIAEGPYSASCSKEVAELYPIEKRASTRSYITAASGFGTGFAALMVTQVTNVTGWRAGFYIYGIIGIVIIAIFLVVGKPWKYMVGNTGNNTKIKKKLPYGVLLKSKIMWLFFIISILSGVFGFGLTSWMPTYWMTVKHLKLTTMGFVSFLPSVFGMIVAILTGWGVEHGLAGKEGIYISISSAICAIFIYLTYSASSVAMGVTCQIIANMSMSVSGVLITSGVVRYCHPYVVGTAAGLLGCFQQGSGIFAPALMGFILDKTKSFALVFVMVVACMAVCVVLGLFVKTKDLKEHPIAGEWVAQMNQ